MHDQLFPPLAAELRAESARLLETIDRVFPLPSRFRAELPRDVAALSRLLTADRSDREGGYLGKPAELSAYLRYFLPWNVYRLSRLLTSLPLDLKEGDVVTDLGAGPLTVAIALWLSRPDLRGTELEFRCLDRTGKVLEAGASLFSALSGEGCRWKIRTIRGPIGARVEGPKAALTTAANVLNELFWDDRHPVPEQAERKASFLSGLTRDDGRILVVEPGIPRSGSFLSELRRAFIEAGRVPLSPCPHAGTCPLPGGRRGAKWCHFAFDTDEAPERLLRLSAAAGIPKERATLSFLYAGPDSAPKAPTAAASDMKIRVVSDAFPLPDGSFGRYACAARGLVLLSGDARGVEAYASGSLAALPAPQGSTDAGERDAKSGALVFRLPGTKAPRAAAAGTPSAGPSRLPPRGGVKKKGQR